MKKYLQRLFINWLVKDLFNALDVHDILDIRGKGIVIYRGKRLTEEAIQLIKDGSTYILESVAWKMLTNEAKLAANQRMFEKSKVIDDIMFGKAMLYDLELLDQKLKQFSQL